MPRPTRRRKTREGRLDEYVATFQDLANRAGMDLNDPTAMTTFAQGLQGTLAETCVMQDGPENFPQWGPKKSSQLAQITVD